MLGLMGITKHRRDEKVVVLGFAMGRRAMLSVDKVRYAL